MSRCEICLSAATFSCPDCKRSACAMHWQELKGHVDYVSHRLPDDEPILIAVPARCYAGLDIDYLAESWSPGSEPTPQLTQVAP